MSATTGLLLEKLCGVPAAARWLAGRGLVRATGTDRVRFLDGMLTHHVEPLLPGESAYMLALDRKGRILADLHVLVVDEAHLLDAAPGAGEPLLAALRSHLVADLVELEDLTREWRELAVEGRAARGAVLAAGGRGPAPGRVEAAEGLIFRGDSSLAEEGVRVLGPREAVEDFARALALPQLSDEQAEILRVEAFVPAFGVDFDARSFPQEARLERAVSTTKGCYVGQEIVARLSSRGAVNQFLVQLRAERPVARGESIRHGASVIGEITSSVVSPLSGPLALGRVRSEHASPGTRVEVGAVAATTVAATIVLA